MGIAHRSQVRWTEQETERRKVGRAEAVGKQESSVVLTGNTGEASMCGQEAAKEDEVT